MTEAEYILVSNLQRLREINQLAGWLTASTPAEKGARTEILDQVYHWITRLEREVEKAMTPPQERPAP